MSENEEFVERLIAATNAHVNDTEDPEMAIGDLEQALFEAVTLLTPEQLAQLIGSPSIEAILEWEELAEAAIADLDDDSGMVTLGGGFDEDAPFSDDDAEDD